MNNSFLLLVLNIAVMNTAKHHIGKIVGLYLAVSATGKIFYTGLHQLFFTEYLQGYFLSISVTWLLVYGLCGVFHRPSLSEEENKMALKDLSKSPEDSYKKVTGAGNDQNKEIQDGEDTGGLSLQQVFHSPSFHLMFWSSALFQASVMACLNNLSSMANSTGMHNPLRLVYIISVSICFVRLLFGAMFDFVSTKACGFALLWICYMMFLAAMVLGLWFINEMIIYVLTVFVGVGLGAGNSVSLSMLVRLFGKEHYSVISAGFYLVFTVFTVLLQTMIGLFYDNNTNNSGIFCYGPDCFQQSFIVFFVLTLVVLGVQVFNMIVVLTSN